MSHRSLLVILLAAVGCQSPTPSKADNAPAAPAAPVAKASEPAAASAAGPGRDLDPNAPVARMKAGVITGAELNEATAKDLGRAEMEYQEKVYQIRKQALDNLINKKLLEPRAKAKGMDPDQLAAKEISEKVKEPNEKEIQALYDDAKAHGQQLPPIDQVKPQIVQYLTAQKRQSASGEYYAQLRKEGKVQLLLPTFKREVPAVGPSKGPEKAPVTIVEFSDFECPFCSRAEETVNKVMAQYKGKIRLVYRDFPLPMHSHAQKASEAAHCAEAQGKYWPMHEKLFSNQQALEVGSLKGYAKDLKLDGAKFEKCLDSGETAAVVAASQKAGAELGVTGTPAFFINGQMLSGAQPFEAFKAIIDPALEQQ